MLILQVSVGSVAVADVPRDAVQKGDAQGYLGVELHDVRWDGCRGGRPDVFLCLVGLVNHVSLQKGDVWAVKYPGTADVIHCDQAVCNVAVIDAMLKYAVGRATKDMGELAGGIRSFELAAGEEPFLISYSLEEGVRDNGFIQDMCRFHRRSKGSRKWGGVTYVEAVVKFSELVDRSIVGAVDEHGAFCGSVHGDTAKGGNVARSEDVAERMGIVPGGDDGAGKTGEVTHVFGGDGTALGG